MTFINLKIIANWYDLVLKNENNLVRQLDIDRGSFEIRNWYLSRYLQITFGRIT